MSEGVPPGSIALPIALLADHAFERIAQARSNMVGPETSRRSLSSKRPAGAVLLIEGPALAALPLSATRRSDARLSSSFADRRGAADWT
jgi:hypothetical protein